jgi:hemolysin activation/secretion protein
MQVYRKQRALAGAAGALALAAAMAVQAAPAVAQDATRFDVRAFQVKGNTVLPTDVVERAVYPFMGPGRTSDDVEAARAALQAVYEERGFIAVSVFIPEQSVEGGVLMLEVAEQAIGQVLVEGATKPDAVRALAPSLTPGQTPNLPEFQRDVVALNQNPTRRVTPELRAGEAPGTLDVVLAVEESSPWHGSLELNNYYSASTTQWRTAAPLRHDNLWGRGDSLSLSAQTAPERTTDGTVYSGNYLMRLGGGTQLLAYAVHSDSDIAVVGGTNVIGKGDLAGLRLIRALGGGEGFYHSLTLGLDWKSFKEDVILGSDRAAAPIEYFPAMASWRGDWSGEGRRSDLTLGAVMGVRGLGDDKWAFDAKRYNARQSFFTVKLDASHTEEMIHDLQLMAKVSAQWTDRPLISNEQLGIGGQSSVRAYRESEAMGDYGLATQLELRSPPLLSDWPGVDEIRLYGFWDAGFAGIHDPLPGQKEERLLMSAGLGGRVRLFRYLNGAVDVGTPLISMPGRDAGLVSVRFRIWGEF